MSRQPGRVRVTAIGFFLSIGIFLLADFDRQSSVGAEADEGRSLGLFRMYHYDVRKDEASGEMKDVFIPLVYEVRRVDHGGGTYTDHFILQENEWKKVGNLMLAYSKTTFKGLIPLAYTLEVETYTDERKVIFRGFYEYRLEYPANNLDAAYNSLLTGKSTKLAYEGAQKILAFYCPKPGPCEKASGEEGRDSEEALGGEFNMRVVGTLDTGGTRLLMIRFTTGLYCYDPDRELVVGQSTPDNHFVESNLMTFLEAKFEESDTVRAACLRVEGQAIP
jgi:hypothetical protein